MPLEAKAKIPTSPLMQLPEEETIETPNYSEEEQRYLSNLQKRLENAKLMREQPHPEFDDMTYLQYWQKNEDLANTKIKPKVNKQDIQFQFGTLRTKLFAFLSSLLGLNLSGDITAYNESDVEINRLGDAMEDIIDKTDELDEDEEKKMLRQYELLKQGDVFCEDIWDEKWMIEKDPMKNYNGEFRNVKIKSREVKGMGRPVRNIISGLSVYLGDLTKYLISDQPYIFTAETKRYDETEKIYGKCENWKYVSKKMRPWSGDSDKAMTMNAWRLLDTTQENTCEIIKYQDKPNFEYQTVINGVPMWPIGFPFPWGYNEYTITQQHFKPIRHDFAYGKSFTFENKNPIQVLDEMMRMILLKTMKSLLPPYINTSGRVITSKVLMPGEISMGIQPNTLIPISPQEVQGVTNAEFQIVQELIKTIDMQTASQTFTGGREEGQVTATQIVELQRQARIMLGIVILSASLLEKKLITLRLMNILKYWFDPIDNVVDKARNILRNKYRIISRQRNIEGEGMGLRFVVPTEELPTSEQIMANENQMKTEMGVPVRIIALNPQEISQTKLTWVISVNPREKRSSEMSKLMFKAEIQDAIALGLQLNPAYISERFAETWGEDPSKLFAPQAPAQPTGGIVPPAQGGGGMAPTIKRPQITATPETPAPAPGIT